MIASRWRRCTALVLLAAAATVSASCSAGTNDAGAGGAESIVVGHAWAKAQDEGDTAVFGMVMNATSSDVTVVSAASDAATTVELHETTESADGQVVMAEIPGGLHLPAGEPLMLEPGGDHLMLMGLVKPLQPGDEITVTLTLDDGTELSFVAPVKDFSGANETYVDEQQGHG